VQERLAAEVTTVMDAHEGILPYDLTNQLDYLDMVALGMLRVDPSVFNSLMKLM